MAGARWAAWALAGGLLAWAGEVRAQDPTVDGGGVSAGFDAWEAWRADEPVTARRLAEEALAADPSDLWARLALGAALHDTGELAAARYHLEELDRLFRWYGDAANEDHWRPHAWALVLLTDVCGAMDDRPAQLAWADAHDEQYDPDLDGSRPWALMKLRRYDEAFAVVDRMLASGDAGAASQALTSACALHMEMGHREAGFDACLKALEHDETEGFDLAVAAHNALGAALAAHRFDQAERIARKGLQSAGEDVSNPWQALTELFLVQGRGPEAVEGLAQMQRWRLRQRPELRDQTRASLDLTVAQVLWVAGRPERALEVVERALQQPDRLGFSSGQQDQDEATARLLRLALRRATWERVREDAAAGPWWWRLWVGLRSWLPDAGAASDAAVVRGVLSQPGRMAGVFRVYLYGGLGEVMPWWLGEVVDVLGTGVAGAALALAEERDADDPALAAWYDALGAEIAWRAGDRAGALARAEAAWTALPDVEALLRARVAAVAGDAAWRSGAREAAMGWYTRALRLDAGVLRRLGLALPAQVDGAGPAAAAIARSARLTSAPDGFRVTVDADRACLLTPGGERLRCAGADGEGVEGLVRGFHLEVFSLPAQLGRFSMDSLDGTTAARREASAAELDRVLDQVEAP